MKKFQKNQIMWRVALVLMVTASILTVTTLVQSGGGFAIPWWTVDGGGGESSSDSYHLAGTIGQPESGPLMSSNSYTFSGGFWGGVSLDAVSPSSRAYAPWCATLSPIAVTWQANDAGSGVDTTALWVKAGSGGAWSQSGLSQTGTGGTFSYIPAVGYGRYYFATVAADQAGNVETTPTGTGDDFTDYQEVCTAYMPVALNHAALCFAPGPEQEPNNSTETANGLLCGDGSYTGTFNDANDYFRLQAAAGLFNITLAGYAGGDAQVLLYDHSGTTLVAQAYAPDYHLQYTGAAGVYYIRVYIPQANSAGYTLQVVYP